MNPDHFLHWVSSTKRIIVGLVLFFALASTTLFADEQKTLKNADVIKMVKAELPDSTIILAIQGSILEFDTQPDALIELKTAGVSSKVIETMLTPRTPPSASVRTNASEVKSDGPAPSHDEWPTAYGFYAFVAGKPIPLQRTEVERVFGLIVGGSSDRGVAVDGFKETSDTPTLDDPNASFVVYEHEVDPSSLKFAQLQMVSQMSAMEFNILKTREQFFESVYGVSPNQSVDVKLLRPGNPIKLRVEPVPGKSDMYRLIPQKQLQPGVSYTFYTSEALHDGDTIFTGSPRAKTSTAILFKISSK
jgi:hypothetical protein